MATASFDLQPFGMLIGHSDITNPARPEAVTGGILFSGTQTEEAVRIIKMPSDYASTPVVKINGSMVSATAGTIDLVIKCVAVSAGDAQDIDAKAYDSDNSSGAVTVPGTVVYPFSTDISIALANNDSLVAADYLKMFIFRDHDSVNDNVVTDFLLRVAVLEYTKS
ncbi:MAG: hypothetical protein KAS32_25765 [Candidatus Peribacteraceae bacterium]|nr:hypothetical protein [Candidatus Peribacteraceae bacterium]